MALVSDRTRILKTNYHHTFEVRASGKTITRHTLLLNPQNLSQTETSKSSVTQTLGGAYVVDFGSGLPVVTISGTTGYRQRYNADGELRDGYEEFMHFRNQVHRKFVETNDPNYQMFWYNWEDEEYWCIQPSTFRLQRSVSEPLLYRYDFSFTCLKKAQETTAPALDQITDVISYITIGNKLLGNISSLSEVLTSLKPSP